MNSVFVNRIIRACKLDVRLYEEVEADKSATFQAALVVILSSLAAGVGALSLGASNSLLNLPLMNQSPGGNFNSLFSQGSINILISY